MTLDHCYQKFEGLDLEPILFTMVVREDGPRWEAVLARTVAGWYRKFLYLNYLYPNECLVPNEAIDEFWHCHILDTLKYSADCKMLFGYYLHHFPYVGLRGSEDKAFLAERFANTMHRFTEHFRDDPLSALMRINAPTSFYKVGGAFCAGACAGTIEHLLARPVLGGGHYDAFSSANAEGDR